MKRYGEEKLKILDEKIKKATSFGEINRLNKRKEKIEQKLFAELEEYRREEKQKFEIDCDC